MFVATCKPIIPSRGKDKCILFLCFSANRFCVCKSGGKGKERNGGRTVLRESSTHNFLSCFQPTVMSPRNLRTARVFVIIFFCLNRPCPFFFAFSRNWKGKRLLLNFYSATVSGTRNKKRNDDTTKYVTHRVSHILSYLSQKKKRLRRRLFPCPYFFFGFFFFAEVRSTGR